MHRKIWARVKIGLAAGVAGVALAGCYAEVGEVVVGFSCAGEGCGQRGDLRAEVRDCGENVGVYGVAVERAVTLGTAAEPLTMAFEVVPEGTRCVRAFLDVDTNGEIGAGDVVTSSAEIPVRIMEDEVTKTEVILDRVVH